MMAGSRALTFASRWFDAATVARVFEPLVADWQRQPRGGWIRPLPWIAATLIAAIAFVGLFFFGFQVEKAWQLPPGTGCWLPIAAFAVWLSVTKYCRPLLLARV